ncbi:hypothetical protein JCM8097_004210 [Rhodosporidiobolus ruineniae]
MASEDPLLLLREALTRGVEIQLVDDKQEQVFELQQATDLVFTAPSRRAFPKTTPTRFCQGSNPDDPSAQFYELQSLLLAYLNRDASVRDYFPAFATAGVPPVGIQDRKVVTDYLGGKTPVEGPPYRLKPLAGGESASSSKRAAGADGAGTGSSAAAGGAGGAGGAAGAPPQKKARYVPNRDDQETVKRMMQVIEGPAYGHVVGPGEEKKERQGAVYHNRETVLRGERVNNFENVRALVGPRLKTLKDEQNSKSSSSQQPAAVAPGAKPQKKKQLNPIIIISPSSTALITMHNVKQFLEEARYVPSDLARQETAAFGVSTDMIQVNHARSTSAAGVTAETRKARYFIVDGVEALSKFGGAGKLDEAWDRVVCVMTTGQEWQFKPYKWKEPKELFHHVKGIYPQWTSDPPNAKIKSWNVNELRIDPHKRHVDKSTVADFWRQLEAWIAQNKPWLSY